MKMNYNVYGERIMVTPFLVKKPLTNTEEFKGVVEVVSVGHKFDPLFSIEVGDKLLVSAYQELWGEFYVLPSQIVRKV